MVIKDVPKKYIEVAIKRALEHNPLLNREDILNQRLDASFVFDKTPEGYAFWMKLVKGKRITKNKKIVW